MINEIAREYEIHPIQESQWKKELFDRLPEVFNRKSSKKSQDLESEHLHNRFSQLTTEADRLKIMQTTQSSDRSKVIDKGIGYACVLVLKKAIQITGYIPIIVSTDQ